MHLHIKRVRRNGKAYEYAQLVQSVRRPSDGMPVPRVIAELGALSAVEIENLRAAIAASRQGKRVVIDQRKLPRKAAFAKPLQNLRYLDVAVLVELWRDWGLDALLAKLLPIGEADVAPAAVAAALTLQRCVDPGSKLYAERWFPRTALPEVLGVAPAKFNNTRIHRVLDQLEQATPKLMRELPRLYQQRQGAFASLFLDVTDTWFVGHGPDIAEVGKTKEGLFQRKIGIVLLCNEHGLPLRWQVIAGKCADAAAMHDLVGQLRGLRWVGNAPVVCDRSMGTTKEIQKLLATKLRFVTALKVTEFGSYADTMPHQCLHDLEPPQRLGDEEPDEPEACVEEAARRVSAEGMQVVSPTMYVLDLGVVERDAPRESTVADVSDVAGRAMQLTRELERMVQQGLADTEASAERRLGVSRHAAKWYRRLRRLDPAIQQDLIDGRAAGLSITKLAELGKLSDGERQRRAYERLLLDVKPVAARSSKAEPPDDMQPEAAEPLRVRVVVCFNPERFVEERRQAQQQLTEVQTYVQQLNERLAHPRCHRKARHIEKELDRLLSRKNLLDVFRVEVLEQKRAEGRSGHHVRLELDVARWRLRRRYDGFSVILSHPEVTQSAADICRLYRAKDAVERDFRTIKSLVKLRPVRHRTSAKVRAHVTLCMLSLLLERALDMRLAGQVSAAMALQTLATCCLNRFAPTDEQSSYIVTHPDDEQRALLKTLRLDHLVDDDAVAERLQPR